MSEFYQQGPELKNQYTDDPLLQRFLRLRMPREVLQSIEKDLREFGAQVAGPVAQLGRQAELEPPVHVPYDPYGRRIDDIKVSPAWNELHAVSAREGIVAIGYERKQDLYSRLYQFAKLYLFHPSSAFYSCPLAMADGAARVLEVHGDQQLKNRALRALTSRDPKSFWTSGQWMTEKTGGSDVSLTSTVAKRQGEGFALYGTKWFSSATTSEMALALGRIEGAPEGSKGLSLFYLEVRKPDGSLNHITVNRLKDKLGTKALPTAELTLNGTVAQLVEGEGNGVKKIATMLNITRLYNSVCSLGQMRRALVLAEDYSQKRFAFGHLLKDQPLHQVTMQQEWAKFELGFLLTMQMGFLLGKDELGVASEDEVLLLRLLTPVAKLFTGKMAVQVVSEAVECFGGAGYVEDTGLPVLLRDAQVFPIWEGTTNVLSLDVLRVLQKSPDALKAFMKDVVVRLKSLKNRDIQTLGKTVELELEAFKDHVSELMKGDPIQWQRQARDFAFKLAHLYSQSLRLELLDQSEL